MNGKRTSKISRREFARRAALASAAATLAPANVISSETPAPSTPAQQPEPPKLSPEGHAEVEARIRAILDPYGNRFSKEQKADIRRLCALAQQPLDRLRAYSIENGDGPALYLKPLVEREKKPPTKATSAKTGATPAKPVAPATKPAAPAKKN